MMLTYLTTMLLMVLLMMVVRVIERIAMAVQDHQEELAVQRKWDAALQEFFPDGAR